MTARHPADPNDPYPDPPSGDLPRPAWQTCPVKAGQMTPEQKRTAAEFIVLQPDRYEGLWQIKPYACTMCPFGAKAREPYHEISNDPEEAHYICPILSKDVWGESPECGEEIVAAVKEIIAEHIAQPLTK